MAANPAGTEPKVAVISGGTRGIGLGIAKCLARDSYSLVLGYNSNTAAAEAAQQQLRDQYGVPVEIVGGDACQAATWDALFDRVQQRFDGHVTAFVHNAGLWIGLTSVSDAQPNLDGDDSWEEAFKYYHEVSVLGFSRGLRRALACKGLRHVVAISAQGCNNSSGPHVGYEAQGQGKAGLEFLVRRNALALAAQGVNVNAIVPGCTMTDALTTLMGGEERVQRMIDATPAKRAASPEEIGELAAFLCSPRAAFLTGASIPMDGGLHLRG